MTTDLRDLRIELLTARARRFAEALKDIRAIYIREMEERCGANCYDDECYRRRTCKLAPHSPIVKRIDGVLAGDE